MPLGKFVAACEARALARHGADGRFSVAVSGGSLPKVGVLRHPQAGGAGRAWCAPVGGCGLVRRVAWTDKLCSRQTLAAALEASKNVLHFERWTVLYADERCVALDRAYPAPQASLPFTTTRSPRVCVRRGGAQTTTATTSLAARCSTARTGGRRPTIT